MAQQETKQKLPNGPAAAAILAAGAGSLALGLLAVLSEASSTVNSGLKFYGPAGPLSGKTTLAVAVWLVSWLLFHLIWRKTDLDFPKFFWAAMVMIILGLIGTFPPFFALFAV